MIAKNSDKLPSCLIVEFDHVRRRRLVSAIQESGLFACVSSLAQTNDLASVIRSGCNLHLIFISDSIDAEELKCISEAACQVSEDTRPGIVLVSHGTKSWNCADGEYLSISEPYSTQRFTELLEQYHRVRHSRANSNTSADIRFIIEEAARQLDILCYLRKRNLPANAYQQNLRQISKAIKTFSPAKRDEYFDLMAECFAKPNDKLKSLPVHLKLYEESELIRQTLKN